MSSHSSNGGSSSSSSSSSGGSSSIVFHFPSSFVCSVVIDLSLTSVMNTSHLSL